MGKRRKDADEEIWGYWRKRRRVMLRDGKGQGNRRWEKEEGKR